MEPFRQRHVVFVALVGYGLVGCALAAPALPAVSPQGDVGLAGAPCVIEQYAVRGVVREESIAGNIVKGARITAYRNDTPIAKVISDNSGRFVLLTTMTGNDPATKAPEDFHYNPVQLRIDFDPIIVIHYYPGVNKHPHWTVTLEIEADGFEKTETAVELPRPVKSDPVEVMIARIPDDHLSEPGQPGTSPTHSDE
jgi:hypothetical protein